MNISIGFGIAIWVNKKTEAYLKANSLKGESLAVTAGRLLKELAEKKGVSG
ncbi:MAG: hypothetical protein WBK67_01480 [Minisyncoccales bacterium]